MTRTYIIRLIKHHVNKQGTLHPLQFISKSESKSQGIVYPLPDEKLTCEFYKMPYVGSLLGNYMTLCIDIFSEIPSLQSYLTEHME